MVKVGEVFWVASVKGVGEASSKASDLDDSMEGVAATAMSTADAQNTAAEATRGQAEATEEADRWGGRLRGTLGLVSSGLFFVADKAGVASLAMGLYTSSTSAAAFASGVAATAAGGLSTALTGVAGAATTAWAAIAGPAGLAVGLLVAVAAVGLLGSELLGLTDVTPVAEAETDSMAGAFADMAFLIGGPLVGFMSAGFSLLTGDFTAAKNKFINTSVEWAKASARFAARVQAGLGAFAIAVKTGVAAAVEAADFAWRAGWNGMLTFTQKTVNSIANSVVGGIEGALNAATGGINSLIRKANEIPHVNIGTVGNISLGGRDPLDVGAGTVQNEALGSRLQRVRTQGNRELRQLADLTRSRLDRFRPDTIGGDRRTRGGGGDAPAIGEQRVNVSFEGTEFDPSNMSRADRRELARMIGNEVGSSVGDQAGGR